MTPAATWVSGTAAPRARSAERQRRRLGPAGVAGGTDGRLLDAGTDAAPPAPELLGKPCDAPGTLACNGNNQKQTLLCQSDEWQAFNLAARARTATSPTACAPTSSGTAPRTIPATPGASAISSPSAGPTGSRWPRRPARAVRGRACRPAVCGDGKIEGSEGSATTETPPPATGEADCKLSQVVALTAGARTPARCSARGWCAAGATTARGQLGLGTTANLSGQPPYKNGLVPLGAAAVAVAAGDSHTCALMADQSVRCWGANGDGQLGLGTPTPSATTKCPTRPTPPSRSAPR